MKLKVYAITMICTGEQARQLGLQSFHRQAWAVVAAPSQKAAAKAFGITQHYARGYMAETGNEADIEMAMSAPGTVFARAMHDSNGPAIQIKRDA